MTPTKIYTPRHPPASYPAEQLKEACLIAESLGRGNFVLLTDPEDG